MSSPGQYLLRWRGQQSGPFSLTVIEQKLDEHVIGLSCEIRCDGQWITLEEFFATRDEQRRREAASQPIRINLATARPPGSPAPGLPAANSPAITALPPTRSTQGIVSEAGATLIPASAGRRRIVFAMLGIFLGFLGVHNFYAGYTRIGILQLVLTGLAALLGFNLIFTWVWALVEVLFVHTDSRGAPLA